MTEFSYVLILTQYKRNNLEKQLKHIINQTVQPKYLVVYQNESWVDITPLKEQYNFIHIHNTNYNTKFFGRFSHAFNYDVDYVIVLDDDMMPGKKCFEHYLKSCESMNAIMGGNGRYLNKRSVKPAVSDFGIRLKHTPIDFVGHLWCIKKDWLYYMFSIKPFTYDTAEDMHLCFSCKLNGIKSFVCSQPDKESDCDLSANKFAGDEFASYKITSSSLRNDVQEYFMNKLGLTICDL